MIVTQNDANRATRIVVECKAYSRLVGLRTMRSFNAVAEFLRGAEEVDEAWLVATRGFTPNAARYAERAGIRLWTSRQLFGVYGQPEPEYRDFWPSLSRAPHHGKKRLFVIMPFNDAMDDVFILGIRWAAQRIGVVAVRADDLLHNGEIIGEIQSAIRTYDGVIGDTTGANANVCYEVGYAHALNRPTVLICRKGESLPFDLRGVNHLMYRNVVDLRDRLPRKLKATLNIP